MDTLAILDVIREISDAVVTPRWRTLWGESVLEKTPGDPVTIADRQCEACLNAALKEMFPDALIVGEESSFLGDPAEKFLASADHAFVIDPLDGTKGFVSGSHDFAVMLAEVKKGETVRSWIWQPIHQHAFVAELGAGVWRDGERVIRKESGLPPLGRSMDKLIQQVAFEGMRPIQSTRHCAGVDYPDLCMGEIDFLIYRHSYPWDHLPGVLMVRELGGEAIVRDGRRCRAGVASDLLVVARDEQLCERVRREWLEQEANPLQLT